jgi:hypothetical protein
MRSLAVFAGAAKRGEILLGFTEVGNWLSGGFALLVSQNLSDTIGYVFF